MQENIDNSNLSDIKLLNKKRKKSKSKRKSRSCISPKSEDNALNKINISKEKNIDIARKKIQYFFNFKWEDDSFEKETLKIAKFLDACLFWYLINSSYFSESNIDYNVKNIAFKYLEKDNFDNNCENLNIKVLKNSSKYKKLDKIDLGIICFLDLDKEGKYFQSVFCQENTELNLNSIKRNLLNYIISINKINEERINKLFQIAKNVEKEYNSKNEINQFNEENIELKEEETTENFMYSKNKNSYLIRKKFWNYLYLKEKDFLINRDSKNEENLDIKCGEEKEMLLNNCYICNCGDLGQYDIIYECVVCGIKVHQECYGIKPNTEQKNWKCSKCKKMKYREAANLECLLCPCKGGAMKQTKISKESDFYKNLMKFRGKIIEEEDKKNNIDIIKKDSSNIKHPDHPWIHLSCVFGNEDVKINMNGKKKNIKFEEINIIKKYKSFCDICKQSNFGPTIKCKIEDCHVNCHPECARMNGCYIEIENLNFSFYCHKHRPNRFKKYFNKLAKSYNDEIFFFSDALDCVYKLYNLYKNKEFYPFINIEQNRQIRGKINEKELKNKKDKIQRRIYLKSIKKANKISKKKNQIIMKSMNTVNKNEDAEIKNDYLLLNTNINNSYEKKNLKPKFNEKYSSSYSYNSFHKNKDNIYKINSHREVNFLNTNRNSINFIDKNKSLTECENKNITSENKKNEFASHLIKYLRNFFENNRIVCYKKDGIYSLVNKEDNEEFIEDCLENFTLSDLNEGKYDINTKFDFNLFNMDNSQKFETIYRNEEDFRVYFNKKIKDANIIKDTSEKSKENKKFEKNLSRKRIGKSKYKK